MSDLPTRDDMETSARAWSWTPIGRVMKAYVNGDLLTREEAAADPEVKRMIRDAMAAKWPLRA